MKIDLNMFLEEKDKMKFEEPVEGNDDSAYVHKGTYRINKVNVPIEVETFRGHHMDIRAGAISPLFGCSPEEVRTLSYLHDEMLKKVFGRNSYTQDIAIATLEPLRLKPSERGLVLKCVLSTDNLSRILSVLESLDER